jgi:hypothetical protein
MRRISMWAGWAIGVFLVIRALAEPFTIEFGNPASYADDWGGPSLLGVLTVHVLPGIVAAVIMIGALLRRHDLR